MSAALCRALFACVCLLLLPLSLTSAAAQESRRVANPGTGTLALPGPWRFHTGNNPAWADATFDDASWRRIDATDSWSNQGAPTYTGFAWYRLTLDIAGPGPQLSLLLAQVDDNYEVFWNGTSIGLYGGFPPNAHLWSFPHSAVYPFPLSSSNALHGTLALRVWKSQLASNDPATLGGLNTPPLVGAASTLDLLTEIEGSHHAHRFLVRELLSSVVLIAGFISLLIFFRGGRQPLFLWLAIYLVADSASALEACLLWYQATLVQQQVVNAIRVTACTVALWFILLHLFGMATNRRWRTVTAWLSFAMLASQVVDCTALFFWQYTSPLLQWTDALTSFVYTVLPAYLFVLLAVGLKRHSRISLWPLGLAVFLYGFYNVLVDTTSQGSRFTGLHWSQAVDSWAFSLGTYPVGVRTLLDIFFLIALLLTVARQQAFDRQRRAAVELELKSAQEIQRVLVPDQLPQFPNFLAEAVYRPAEEVGGDFFQIIPVAEGGFLVVIGDVSGKGLKAAMTVSLIVGAVRTLADTLTSPSAILAGLNRRLVGRTAGGFATCLALHLDQTGVLTLANAGHLAPFLNGREILLEGSIPLGILEDVVYPDTRCTLDLGDRLTLYTDGLLEARDPAGHLFGFDRVAALLAARPSLNRILEEAITFGQEDDITLLSLTRTASPTDLDHTPTVPASLQHA